MIIFDIHYIIKNNSHGSVLVIYGIETGLRAEVEAHIVSILCVLINLK